MGAGRFDSWGHHPTTFSFPALERAVETASASSLSGPVVDPFVGSGKAATFITTRGDDFVGIEAHPLIARLARTKLSRPGRPDELRRAGARLAEQASHRALKVNVNMEQELVQRFVPAQGLAELVAYRDSIDPHDPWSEHLLWAVLGCARDLAGREWPYNRPRRRPSSQKRSISSVIAANVGRMADDLAFAPQRPRGEILLADARSSKTWSHLTPGTIAASISSPPYLNGISYAEATRFELHFLGLARSWREMKLAAKLLVASCTQEVTKSRAAAALTVLETYPATRTALRTLTFRLTEVQRARPRAKRYDLLLACYFADMLAVLENLHRAMSRGARAAWVVGDSAPYGVYIDTPGLLGVAATEVGFEVLDDLHLRSRGTRWPRSRPGRDRLLSERLLVFRRPPPPVQQPLPGMSQWLD